MWLIDKLADAHINAAIERGEFDNLPGAGKPLQLDDDTLVPPELRAGYRLLKNAGCLPPELTLLNEIRDVQQLIRAAQTNLELEKHKKRLNHLMLQLGELRGVNSHMLMHEQYGEKLKQRLTDE